MLNMGYISNDHGSRIKILKNNALTLLYTTVYIRQGTNLFGSIQNKR